MECSGDRRIQAIITSIVRTRHRPDRYGRYFFLFFVFAYFKACTRRTLCVHVINNTRR